MKPKHLVSFSGGKNSTTMLLMMLGRDMPVDEILFCDTTLEFPEMYKYIDKIEKYIGMEITRLRPPKSWDEHFYGTFVRGKLKGRRRGFPYMYFPCWWNRIAKYSLLDKAHGSGNVAYIGIAADEYKRVLAKQYNKPQVTYRFPLCEWGMTDDDCYDYLIMKDLKHPLSMFKRTGCWLCQKQSEDSLRLLQLHYPELWVKLKQYEKDSPHGFKPYITLDELEVKFRRSDQ